MASFEENENKSQFFITLGETKWFDRKHTLFGKIVGETIFNLMNMNNLDTDKKDRPLDPPLLKRTHVIINPFDDIAPRALLKNKTTLIKKPKKVLRKRKPKKY